MAHHEEADELLKASTPRPTTELAFVPDVEGPSRVQMALQDLREGCSKYWVWTELALRDIRHRYQGSIIGPFWVTLSVVILIVVIGLIYTQLLGHEARVYLPYITVGLVLWQFIGSALTSGPGTFISAQSIMQQTRMPLSNHVFRQTALQLLTLLHMIVVIPIVLLMFNSPVTWRGLYAVPGVLILIFNTFWLSAFLGIISARFRDIPQIIGSMIQILFFLTPVFWFPNEMKGLLGEMVKFNPFFAAIDVIRAPLLNLEIQPTSWPVLFMTTIVGSVSTFLLFARFRARIVFWI